MKFRSAIAAAVVALSMALAGCTSSSTASPSPGPSTAATSPPTAAVSSTAAPATTKGTAAGTATSKSGPASSSGTGKPTAAATTAIVQNTLPPAKSIGNTVVKRKTVTVAACTATADGWRAAGTAVNATGKAVDYTITIFFTTDKATVQDFAVTKLSVPAKTTLKWTADKKFKATQPTLCVLRGVA